jgi:hypothetical protein
MSEHHPSCTPNDRSLVWHCNQCGLDESAEDFIDSLSESYEELKASIADLSHPNCQMLIKDKEKALFEQWEKAAIEIERLKQQLGEQLEESHEILKACLPFAHAWAATDLEDRIRDALVKT